MLKKEKNKQLPFDEIVECLDSNTKSYIKAYLKDNNVYEVKFYSDQRTGNEKIINPPETSEPIFRKLSTDGILERIVRSNKIGKNEYAMASVGFTRANVADDFSSISFRMSGLAFVLKRVNMNPLAENEVK